MSRRRKPPAPVPALTPAQVERFTARILRDTDPTGCWLWNGARSANGYGLFRVGPRVVYAHRIAYALAHPEEPEGVPPELVVDHAGHGNRGCVSKACVRAEHLEAVTYSVNTARRFLRGDTLPELRGEEAAYYSSAPAEELQEAAR